MVVATVARAIALPIHGTERAARLESRAPPHRAILFVVVTIVAFAIAVPERYC
jgi:hypothetical protein